MAAALGSSSASRTAPAIAQDAEFQRRQLAGRRSPGSSGSARRMVAGMVGEFVARRPTAGTAQGGAVAAPTRSLPPSCRNPRQRRNGCARGPRTGSIRRAARSAARASNQSPVLTYRRNAVSRGHPGRRRGRAGPRRCAPATCCGSHGHHPMEGLGRISMMRAFQPHQTHELRGAKAALAALDDGQRTSPPVLRLSSRRGWCLSVHSTTNGMKSCSKRSGCERRASHSFQIMHHTGWPNALSSS